MRAAILVAVAAYADKSIREVKYADADARQFAAVLAQHGFKAQLLVNEQATKTSVESVLRTTLKSLGKDDTLTLFYAGHAFADSQGEGYLSCVDTRSVDAEATSINLHWLLSQLQSAKCRQLAMFLDPGAGTLLTEDDAGEGNLEFNASQFEGFFSKQNQPACFLACQPGEVSHVSSELQHGIWAHHLIEAFDGLNRLALKNEKLTAASLHSYLASAVPITLRKTHPQSVQTPVVYCGKNSDFELADFKEIFAKRRKSKNPRVGQVKDSILLAESIASVKSLSGFQKGKGHNVPDRHSVGSQSFISEIANTDIAADVQRVRTALKTEFKLTRLQLSAAILEGAATITTPYFNYNVSVEQDADDAGNIVWRRSVDAIIDPDKVLSDKFERVFAGVFDTFELSLHDEVNLEELIDYIEALGSDAIRVEYDEDQNITSCLVRMRGHVAAIKVTPRTFSIVHPRAASPQLLIKSFFDIQLELTDTHNVQAIPFEPAAG